MACWAATGPARPSEFPRDQGQVGHRGRQVQLECRLGAPEVARLADSQLDQPRQTVLHYHPALAVLAKGLALLQGPGLLQ